MTRTVLFALSVGVCVAALCCSPAWAGEPFVAPSSTPNSVAARTPDAAPIPVQGGLAVIALPGATDAAWPLAQAVYAEPSLRPPRLDDANARLLCGQPASLNAPAASRDLADTIAALRGDDAPTRALLGTIASRFFLRALLVVGDWSGGASARPFLSETGTFDAATYSPDGPSLPLQWSKASLSLARAFGVKSTTASAGPTSFPALASHEGPFRGEAPPRPRAFYESGWFWGALGAAALGGGALFLATRDSGASTIHLQLQVPR